MADRDFCVKLLTLFPILLLVGCQMTSKVTVIQEQNGVIQIEVLVRGNKSPCVTNIYISHVSEGKMVTDWQIFLNEGERDFCTNKFTYPNVPRHYSLAGNPRPLKAAEEYEVSVAGPGFIGGKEFTRIKLPPKTP
jgi:hypothetical protein